MKSSNDIVKLYQLLGQNPDRYHEIVRDEALTRAIQRWPLLNAIENSDFEPPPVLNVEHTQNQSFDVSLAEQPPMLSAGPNHEIENMETGQVLIEQDPAVSGIFISQLERIDFIVQVDTHAMSLVEPKSLQSLFSRLAGSAKSTENLIPKSNSIFSDRLKRT